MKVFVTSVSANQGNFGGLAGADAFCTDIATMNGGLTGTWTAWLSDTTTDAADRINTVGEPYQLINGTVIADDYSDLVYGALAAPIQIDESGNDVTSNFKVWTATAADGSYNTQIGTCLNWTSAGAGENAGIGISNSTERLWTEFSGENCNDFGRLYCFADANSP